MSSIQKCFVIPANKLKKPCISTTLVDKYYNQSQQYNICNKQHNCDELMNQLKKCKKQEDIDFIQTQIDSINRDLVRFNKNETINKEQYKQVINELDILINNTENNYDNYLKLSVMYKENNKCSNSNNIFITDINKTTEFIIDKDINVIFVTMIGGGGAGGIGCVDKFKYLSGGGGGSGACIIKKPIYVKLGHKLLITVGKGGYSMTNKPGEITKLNIVCTSGKIVTLCVDGGSNGYPNIITKETIECSDNIDVSGGESGKSDFNNCLSGKPGIDGIISFPSQISNEAGCGGHSHFAKAGVGGSNMFNIGGTSGNTNNIVGGNGVFGSGGGGSSPVLSHDMSIQMSGNGGNGFVLIEW